MLLARVIATATAERATYQMPAPPLVCLEYQLVTPVQLAALAAHITPRSLDLPIAGVSHPPCNFLDTSEYPDMPLVNPIRKV